MWVCRQKKNAVSSVYLSIAPRPKLGHNGASVFNLLNCFCIWHRQCNILISHSLFLGILGDFLLFARTRGSDYICFSLKQSISGQISRPALRSWMRVLWGLGSWKGVFQLGEPGLLPYADPLPPECCRLTSRSLSLQHSCELNIL